MTAKGAGGGGRCKWLTVDFVESGVGGHRGVGQEVWLTVGTVE